LVNNIKVLARVSDKFIVANELYSTKQGESKVTLQVGVRVVFKFGKMPKTKIEQDLVNARPRNMTEMSQYNTKTTTIEWVDLYANDIVQKVDEQFVYLRDGYKIKHSEVIEVLK